MAEREHDSTCDRILREGMTEIDRLKYLVQAHLDTIRDHKQQIANLEVEREKYAKRIVSLEDSHSKKCVELDAMSWEVDAGRSVRSAVVELSQLLKEFLLGTDGARVKNLFEPETFQPKRPEEQPQKPTCDN